MAKKRYNDIIIKEMESGRMNRRFKAFWIVALIALLLAMMPGGLADFGDFSGSSDYGSSYDSSSYSSSYSSSRDDDDDDYSWSSSNWGSGGGGGTSTAIDDVAMEDILVLFVMIGIWILYRRWRNRKKNSKGEKSMPEGAKPMQNLLPMKALMEWDPNFSSEAVTQRLSNLYVQMQNHWTNRDISPLRGDFTDAQYEQYDRQLQKYRDAGQTPYVERIAVLGVELRGALRTEQHDILVANIRARITTYTLDDKTGKVVRGHKTDEKFMQYEWTLVRPVGTKTITQDADEAFNCPNCAAPMKINQSAQCPYCQSVVTKADYDWVIAGIKGLSQRTR